jgi:general L-amino acid transport system substrate-binding protein
MTPASLFDLMDPRRLAKGATAFALGFAVSQSDVAASRSHMAEIQARGVLKCGVDTGLTGFAETDENGAWSGFEVDLCRAYAAAFLGDPDRTQFVPTTTLDRFQSLRDGDVDILLRNTSWTLSRASTQQVRFTGVYYYDGQGFLAPADLGLTSAQELSGARICVQPETTSALNLEDYSERYGLNFTTVSVETVADARIAYQAGECDAFTSDVSRLAGFRRSLTEPDRHMVLPDVISKEPLTPVVRAGDPQFEMAVEWVLMALIAAEEYGVTQNQLSEPGQISNRPEVRRLLAVDEDIALSLGVDENFARRAIAAGGHYGELFERNLGEASPLQLERGLNAQWNQGGLLYAPPVR